MRDQIISCVRQEKIVAIVRGVESEKCMKVAQALYDGGIRMMEITYNQKKPESWEETAQVIGEVAEAFSGKMFVGAGTVTCEDLVELTHKYGGQFIISPDMNEAVIRKTRELGLVSMPGAMTPSEIMVAHRAGADFVKLFPAGHFGPGYLKAIRGPISHVDLLVVGGVDENNIGSFLEVGAVGAGVGGNLANAKWIEAGEYHKVTAVAQKLVAAVKAATAV